MFNKIKQIIDEERLRKEKLIEKEKLYNQKLINDFKNNYNLPQYNKDGSKIKWKIWVEKDGEYDIYTGEYLGEYSIYLHKPERYDTYYKYNSKTNSLDDVTYKFAKFDYDYNYD